MATAPRPTAYEQARERLLAALERARPILEGEDTPTNLSFVVYFNQVGSVRKVITRTEAEEG